MSVDHLPLVRRQIEAELERVRGLVVANAYSDDLPFSARMMHQQNVDRVAALEAELEQLEDDVFALAFSEVGANATTRLSTTVLSNLLNRFQRAITFAGWAHVAGPGVTGTPPVSIARAMETDVEVFSHGSFLVPLRPHEDSIEHSVLHQTLEDVLSLASSAQNEGVANQAVSDIAQVIGPEATRRVALFFAKVHEARLETRFEWQLRPELSVVVQPAQAKALSEWLKAVEETFDSIDVSGTLTAADTNNGRFTITDAIGQLHSGSAAPELLSRAVIDRPYKAKLRVTTFTSTTTRTSREHVVLEKLESSEV